MTDKAPYSRQGGDTEPGVAQIEVTPEMICAGGEALKQFVADDDLRQNDKSSMLEAIYRAMASVNPDCCSRAGLG